MFEWIGRIAVLLSAVIVVFAFLVGVVSVGVEIGLERYYKSKKDG